MVEQRTFNPFVVGSTPARPTNIFNEKATVFALWLLFLVGLRRRFGTMTATGFLAQLVEQRTLNPFVASSTLASPTTNISFFLIISIKI